MSEPTTGGKSQGTEDNGWDFSGFPPPVDDKTALNGGELSLPNAKATSLPGSVWPRPTLWTTIAILITLLVVSGSIVLAVGIITRSGWRFSSLPFYNQPALRIIQSANGVVIMNETGNGYSRILVRKANVPGWLLISTDDFDAQKPALAPSGNAVAYVSSGNGGTIVATSLEKDLRIVISPQGIDGQSLKPTPVTKFVLCPWTNVAWSPSSDRIAFFACNTDPALSYLVIADAISVGTVPMVIDNSYLMSEGEREVMWLTDKSLIVNRLSTTGQASIDTTEYTVP
jgi:hypothetical protein